MSKSKKGLPNLKWDFRFRLQANISNIHNIYTSQTSPLFQNTVEGVAENMMYIIKCNIISSSTSTRMINENIHNAIFNIEYWHNLHSTTHNAPRCMWRVYSSPSNCEFILQWHHHLQTISRSLWCYCLVYHCYYYILFTSIHVLNMLCIIQPHWHLVCSSLSLFGPNITKQHP